MGFSNYWDIALNLGFTKVTLPFSIGIVKVKMGICRMLFCHLHSNRQTAMPQADSPLPACEHLYTKMDAEDFRTDPLTADFWMSCLYILTKGTCSLNCSPRQMNGRRRCLPGKMVNPGHKEIENLTFKAIFPRDKSRQSCSTASSWNKAPVMAVHHFYLFLYFLKYFY